MVFALIAVGLLALAGIAEFATDALEEGADEIEDRFNELRNDPRFDQLLNTDDDIITEDLFQLLSDDAESNAAQADVLVLQVDAAPDAAPSDGAPIFRPVESDFEIEGPTGNTFRIDPGSERIITDFRPELDGLHIELNEAFSNDNSPPTLEWRVTENGVELHYATDSEETDAKDSFIALLAGLTEPHPDEGISISTFENSDDDTHGFSDSVLVPDQVHNETDTNGFSTLAIQHPHDAMDGDEEEESQEFGENAVVTGSAGADVFRYRPTMGQTLIPATITDFDPDDDAIVIQLDRFYDGPAIATLMPQLDGEGTLVRIDGRTALVLSQPVSDLSSIVVLQS